MKRLSDGNTLRFSFWISCTFIFPVIVASRSDVLMQLSRIREQEQFNESLPFRSIGQWQQDEGLYRNYVLYNMRGKCAQSQARVNNRVPDVHSFASPCVAMQIIDAHRFGHAPSASQREVERTARLLSGFHDKNRDNTSLIMFYPQSYNETTDFWYTNPENLVNYFQSYDALQQRAVPMATILMGPAPLPDGFDAIFEPRVIAEKLKIPADFDSTSVNLCFGALLYQVQDLYPDAWRVWQEDNQNLESIFTQVKKYAYRPFSNDVATNRIDPRGYYFMRPFLDQAKRDGNDVAILPTWIQNLDDVKSQYYNGNIQPYGPVINAVDIVVHANFLTGLYSALSSGMLDPQLLTNDSELELIINSTASLLVYTLETNMTGRYDLALLDYSSEVQFYWFVARGLMYMENDRLKGKALPQVFETYYQGVRSAMMAKVTDRILALKTVDPSGGGGGGGGGVYYDDFLGTADTSYYDEPINRAEDRLFTTAMAANALVYTWSAYDDSSQRLVWKSHVPEEVKATVMGCADWLEANALSGQYLPLNSFFTLDFKNRESLLYFYPANRFQFLNGTDVEDFSRLPSEPTIYAMEGYVEPDEYERLLKMPKFGSATPLTFPGFNRLQGATVLWSCDALTYSGVLMTVAMNDVLGS